jgi:hypothetical protein
MLDTLRRAWLAEDYEKRQAKACRHRGLCQESIPAHRHPDLRTLGQGSQDDCRPATFHRGASGAKLPSQFNSNRRKCGFRGRGGDVIENAREKNLFSVNSLARVGVIARPGLDFGAQGVCETGSKVMNCDELC